LHAISQIEEKTRKNAIVDTSTIRYPLLA